MVVELEKPFLSEHLEFIKDLGPTISHGFDSTQIYLVPSNNMGKLYAKLSLLSCGADWIKEGKIEDRRWRAYTPATFCRECPDDYSLETISSGGADSKAVFVGYREDIYHMLLVPEIDKNKTNDIAKNFIAKTAQDLEGLCLEGLSNDKKVRWRDLFFGYNTYLDEKGIESRIQDRVRKLSSFMGDLDVLSNGLVKKDNIRDSRHDKEHVTYNLKLCGNHKNK